MGCGGPVSSRGTTPLSTTDPPSRGDPGEVTEGIKTSPSFQGKEGLTSTDFVGTERVEPARHNYINRVTEEWPHLSPRHRTHNSFGLRSED